jgi:hypothetical protein
MKLKEQGLEIKIGSKFVTKLNRDIVLGDGQIASLETVYILGKVRIRVGVKTPNRGLRPMSWQGLHANFCYHQLGHQTEFPFYHCIR